MKKIICYIDVNNNVWYLNNIGLFRNNHLFDSGFNSKNSKIISYRNKFIIKYKQRRYLINNTGIMCQ